MVVVSLIGEQIVPNLLPIRYQLPDTAVMVHTDRTYDVARRLVMLLPPRCRAIYLPVSPYDIHEAILALRSLTAEQSWSATDLIFNLTGGTKSMVLAAYQVAAELGAPLLYLQSEGQKTRLYRYAFNEDGTICLINDQFLPALITIDDYLRAHVDEFQYVGFANDDVGGRFERAIHDALQPVVDEIVAGVRLEPELEVDLVVRSENQIGILEAKTGTKIKKGIDQLNSAGEPRYLGTYVQKILVSDRRWDGRFVNHRNLAKALRITVVELPSFCESQQLAAGDIEHLQRVVCQQLGQGENR